MTSSFCITIPLFLCSLALADPLVNEQTLNLWPHHAPLAEGDEPADTPIVQVFLPKANPTGSSIIVCPGGGYGGLAKHESAVIGQWLADNGITAFVLRYRLGPKYHHPCPLMDAQRAIRFVRSQAKDWNLDPGRIGILGFSAGGHLTSTVATHFDDLPPKSEDPIDAVSARPDVQILIYPVITMGDGGHAGSRKNLLGENPAPGMIEKLSSEKQVTDKTPPAFLVHSTQDTAVPVSNSDNYEKALKSAGIPCQYIRGEHGQHGFGLKDFWTKPCIKWLREQKF